MQRTLAIYILGSCHLTNEDAPRIDKIINARSYMHSKQMLPNSGKHMTVFVVRHVYYNDNLIKNIQKEFPEFEVFDHEGFMNSVYMDSETKKTAYCISELLITENKITNELLFDLFFLWRQSEKTIKEYGVLTTKHEYTIYKPDNLPVYINAFYDIFDKLSKRNIAIMFEPKNIFLVTKMGNNTQLEKELNLHCEGKFNITNLTVDTQGKLCDVFNNMFKWDVEFYSIKTIGSGANKRKL